MGATELMARAMANRAGFRYPKRDKTPVATTLPEPSPLLPQIVSEEVATYAQKRLRKRRGLGSTILTGDLTVDPSFIGKKALLGS